MSSRRKLIVLLAALSCRGDAAKLTLRYHPPAGASYHYTMEQHNDMKFESGPMAQLPAQQMTLRIHFSQAVTGPAAGGGGVGVTLRFDSITVDSPSMAAGTARSVFERLRGLTNAMVFDDRRNVVRAAFTNTNGVPSPLAEEFARNVRGITVPLPEQPVGVGDTWTTEVDLPMTQVMSASAPLKTKTRVTVKEIHAAGADTTVLLGLETTYPTDPITVQSEEGPQSVKLTGNLSGEQVFSVTSGAVVRASAKGTIHIEVKGGAAGGGGMSMSINQAMSLQLVGAP